MDIIDAQVHVFYKNTDMETIAAMDALGIRGCVIDEVWNQSDQDGTWPYQTLENGVRRMLSPLAQAAVLKHPDRFVMLQRVDRNDPNLASLFAILGTTPGCRAVRIDVRSKQEREALTDGGYDELFQLAQQIDFPIFMIIQGRDAAERIRAIANQFPGLQIVLDHCAFPKSIDQWSEILALHDCPNVAIKWSHAHHFFESGAYPFAGLQAQLARALKSFGPQRLMWASDITHDRAGVSWSDLLHYVRDDPSIDAVDKEWILGGTARKILKWHP